MKIGCGKCGQEYDVPEEYRGRKVECEKCHEKFIATEVPSPVAPSPAVAPSVVHPQSTPPPPTPVLETVAEKKKGAFLGALVCLLLAMGLHLVSNFMIWLWAPLYLAAFVLSIVVMAQRKITGGVMIMLGSLICPWLITGINFLIVMLFIAQVADTSNKSPDRKTNSSSRTSSISAQTTTSPKKTVTHVDDFEPVAIPDSASKKAPESKDAERIAKLKERSELRIRYGVKSLPLLPEEKAERQRFGIDDELTAKEFQAAQREQEEADRKEARRLRERSEQRIRYGEKLIPLTEEEKATRKRLGIDDELCAQEFRAQKKAQEETDRKEIRRVRERSEQRVRYGETLIPLTEEEKATRKRLGIDDELSAAELKARQKKQPATPATPSTSASSSPQADKATPPAPPIKRGIRLSDISAHLSISPLGLIFTGLNAVGEDKQQWQINLNIRPTSNDAMAPRVCRLNETLLVGPYHVRLVDCSNGENPELTIELQETKVRCAVKLNQPVYPRLTALPLIDAKGRDSIIELHSRFRMNGKTYELIEINLPKNYATLKCEDDHENYEVWLDVRYAATQPRAISQADRKFQLPKNNAVPNGPYMYTGTQISSYMFERMYAYFSQCLFRWGNQIVDARDRTGKLKSRMTDHCLSIWPNGMNDAATGVQPISRQQFADYIKDNDLYVYIETTDWNPRNDGLDKRKRIRVTKKERFDSNKAKYPRLAPADSASYIPKIVTY